MLGLLRIACCLRCEFRVIQEPDQITDFFTLCVLVAWLSIIAASRRREILSAKWNPLGGPELLSSWEWRYLALLLRISVTNLLRACWIHLDLIRRSLVVDRLGLRDFAWWMTSDPRFRALDPRLWSFLFCGILLSRSWPYFDHAVGSVGLSVEGGIASIFVLLLQTFILEKRLLR